MRVLVWLRADLRIDDNRALAAACRDADDGVVAVFIACPQQWRAHDWADVKVDLLRRSLEPLSAHLNTLNIGLLIRSTPMFDAAPALLLQIAREHQCDAIYFNHEYELNERRRDAALERAAADAGVALRSFDDQTVLPPDALRTADGRFFSVFTPFKRAWLAAARTADIEPAAAPRRQRSAAGPPDAIPAAFDGYTADPPGADLWPAGERAARAALDAFIERGVRRYRDQRDIPAVDGTSKLSAYLALGIVSPRRCLEAARAANAGRMDGGAPGPDVWISELIWREFYRHVLVGFPRVCMHRAFKPATESIRWNDDDDQFAAWCAGRTGYPIVDAAMRELNATGWMHNRLRMVAAMFLTKDLFIDWRRGERYFMRRLVDGDLASNNGGWQWSASTGTDAAPYFRIFNPLSQSARFDPEGAYMRHWLPELRDAPSAALHDLKRLSETPAAACYPPAIVDHAAARERVMRAFGDNP